MRKKVEISFEGSKRNLPDGWKWVKLRQISRLVSGSTPHRGTSENFNGKIPWIKTLDLNCSVVRQTQECISELAFSQIRGEILPIGTVMVAMYGGAGTIGKSGILGLPATTNQAICSILPNAEVFVPEFLHYWLILIRSEWMQYSSGNRRDPNINKEVVGNMYFPLPPLNEQKRIAAILNEQMEAMEKARQNAIAQLEAAKELPTAYLRDVFNSPETQQWDTKKLGEVGDIVAGITLGNRHNKTNTRSIYCICDIIRRSNCAGALQYIPELTWILFLRILDEQEQKEAETAEALDINFTQSLESPYRWCDWAAPYNNSLFTLDSEQRPQGWKRNLLENFNVWCIISLPAGTFVAAGGGVKANILFFTKGEPTEKIWYYEVQQMFRDASSAPQDLPQFAKNVSNARFKKAQVV
ncbi:hypothetical protein A6S26_25200 [Nostoc sp. ATCC 43529]|nr:hypothetical protein A6S26_25200 [Nostoc sp. ATCC 43529]